MAGGTVTPLAILEEIWAGAAERDISLHLDGARIFNAAATLDVPVAKLTRGFATVMFCLSKGLCAPVGSILVGSRALIDSGRSIRKMLGGGMRQAGVLAAAGLIALEEMPARLPEDHVNALWMAERIAEIPGCAIDLETVQTNIVIFRSTRKAATEIVAGLKARRVLSGTAGPDEVRFVTHRDVDRRGCEQALKRLREVLV
jgi:threonine aldolase